MADQRGRDRGSEERGHALFALIMTVFYTLPPVLTFIKIDGNNK